MININLTVSDIPKEKIITGAAEKGSKKYLNITVDKMKDADQFGNTHTVYISQNKEEREQKVPKVYIGKGKEIIFNNTSTEQNQINSIHPSASEGTDLPF